MNWLLDFYPAVILGILGILCLRKRRTPSNPTQPREIIEPTLPRTPRRRAAPQARTFRQNCRILSLGKTELHAQSYAIVANAHWKTTTVAKTSVAEAVYEQLSTAVMKIHGVFRTGQVQQPRQGMNC